VSWRVAADALGVGRLLLAAALPGAMAGGGPVALWLVTLAAASDFVDGHLARRAGRPTSYGALLDSGADFAIVLGGSVQGARLGLVPWLVPIAIGAAVAAYLAATVRSSLRAGRPQPARSVAGRAAGVANYALVLLVTATLAIPGGWWGSVLTAASAAVIALNLGAVTERCLPRARALPGGESRARSPRSSP
jgi:phosphatidylglycerophosphate synthase